MARPVFDGLLRFMDAFWNFNFHDYLPRYPAIAIGLKEDSSETAPTISSGRGVPTHAAANGSLYLRREGAATTTVYARVSGAWTSIGTAAVTAAAAAPRDASDVAVDPDDFDLLEGDDAQAALAEVDAVLAAYADRFVLATIAVADVSGGGTDSTLTLALTRADGTALTTARQVFVHGNPTAYTIGQFAETVTFGTATVGTKIASGNGWLLAETTSAGAFSCPAVNSADGTVYFSAVTPLGGVSDPAKGCVVVASNSDAAAWSE